jgi:hypothetical protein
VVQDVMNCPEQVIEPPPEYAANAHDRYGNRWIVLGGGSQSLYFNTANNRITLEL